MGTSPRWTGVPVASRTGTLPITLPRAPSGPGGESAGQAVFTLKNVVGGEGLEPPTFSV